MKVLEVVESCGAGVGRHVIDLCNGLVSEGHDVTVAYSPHRLDAAFERFLAEKQNEIRFNSLDLRREVSPVSDLRSVVQLLGFVRRKGPFDVIHGHSSKGGGVARIVGLFSGISVVYTPHSLILSSPEISFPKTLVYGLIERVLGKLATSKIIAVSEEESRFIVELGLVPKDRVALIRNSLSDRDFELLSSEADREGLNQKPLIFGSAMRFSTQKAPGKMVEAFVRAAESLPQIPMRLVIAGDGELLGETREKVEQSGWGERISLPGWNADVGSLLRKLDIFLISSLYEAGSYSAMEAMAAKLPIVATKVFGTQKTLSQVSGNVLVPAGDPEALAQGIRKMATLAEPDALRQRLGQIGQANYNYARGHFRQRDALHRTIKVYESLCQSPHADCSD